MNTNRETERVDQKTVKAVQRVLKDRLGSLGFRDAEIYPGRDHDGDPVLFIDAHYKFSERPIDTRATFGLLRALREALEGVGETRFPHVRHHFDDRQQVARSS